MLVCGINPSPVSANADVGYFLKGNRFWPAALAAGLVTADRDGDHAVCVDRVGFTDFVGRVEADASKLTTAELREGADQVEALVREYEPAAVLFTSITAHRRAVSRKATVGVQPLPFGGRPAYVMPSTSGRNASVSLAQLTEHMRAATVLADAAAAAMGNARWCSSHGGVRGGWTDTFWYAPRRTREFHPDAVTLHPHVDVEDLLACIDLSPGASIKDSFATLDLTPHGFEVLFEATWVELEQMRFDWFHGEELEQHVGAGHRPIAPLRIWMKP